MAGLLPEEKQMISEALQIYLQVASQQMPQETIVALAEKAKALITKLDTLGSSDQDGPGSNKPLGISDEWFEKVCQSCENLGPTGCEDGITAKFPGKCDPILKYEFNKGKK